MLRDLRRPGLCAERMLLISFFGTAFGNEIWQPRLWGRQAVLGKQRAHAGGVRTQSLKTAVAADKEVAAGTASVR